MQSQPTAGFAALGVFAAYFLGVLTLGYCSWFAALVTVWFDRRVIWLLLVETPLLAVLTYILVRDW